MFLKSFQKLNSWGEKWTMKKIFSAVESNHARASLEIFLHNSRVEIFEERRKNLSYASLFLLFLAPTSSLRSPLVQRRNGEGKKCLESLGTYEERAGG